MHSLSMVDAEEAIECIAMVDAEEAIECIAMAEPYTANETVILVPNLSESSSEISSEEPKKKKKKRKCLPHNKPLKSKGKGWLCPGVEGFFITFERKKHRATIDAINILDSYFDELVELHMKEKMVEGEEKEQKVKDIAKLIEAELRELKDCKFVRLKTGCKHIVFIQLRRSEGEPGPEAVVHHVMTSIAPTRRQISRFVRRLLPIEVTCYASVPEISKAIKPLIEKHFPVGSLIKFAVVYKARANNDIRRATVINVVANSVPQSHIVDLKNPDKTIVIQICRTVCLIGVVPKYTELSKYNIYELTRTSIR